MVEAAQDKPQVLSDSYKALTKAIAEDDHDVVLQATEQILKLDSSEKTQGAKKARLVSLIKRREFSEALTFLNKHDYLKRTCALEAAYILHRQDLNKQALAKLQQVPQDAKESAFYAMLVAQINYKLARFDEAVEAYLGPHCELRDEETSADQVDGICSNIAACVANKPSLAEQCREVLREHEDQLTSFEFKFNESLASLKQQDFSGAISSLLMSLERAQQEGCNLKELTRFKVQELHLINCLQAAFNRVESADKLDFVLPRNMTQNNLVETNMTAMRDRFPLNAAQFKDLIGNLNWKKFAERTVAQLQSNSLLTHE